MPASVNLSLISPSTVGDYAGCPRRLVWDTLYPPPRETNKFADFGSLAHYNTMYQMGLNPPPVKDFELVVSSAGSLYKGSEEELTGALDVVSKTAMKHIPKGYTWLCEQKKYDSSLLPERVSREGAKGFGGSIDLLSTCNRLGIDFKFVGKPPTEVKLAYLWQMAAYHLVSGCEKFMLLFVTRDAKYVTSCTMNFGAPLWKEFASQVRQGIAAMGHADFARNSYVCKGNGDQCTYCKHHARCALQNMPKLEESMDIPVHNTSNDFMANMYASSKSPAPLSKCF